MTMLVTMTPAATSQKRVFIADDHPLVREWLTGFINQQPDLTVCGEADSVLDAKEAIPRLHPDLAIVDISLKDASGIELIKHLKKHFPKVAILVLSMHDESSYAERALLAGARGYIMKREATGTIVTAIRQVLDGKLFVTQNTTAKLLEHFVTGKDAAIKPAVETLSDRERQVFELLGEGKGTRQIAHLLHVNIKTVQAYCVRMKEKFHLATATELLREAVRHHDSTHRN
jgi:DNA-binding NarL/FixJ family response regulator